MYQVNNGKRYNLSAHQSLYSVELKNVEVLYIAQNFVVVKDEKGKEHILTGNLSICLDELS